jgi:hypothetical protein
VGTDKALEPPADAAPRAFDSRVRVLACARVCQNRSHALAVERARSGRRRAGARVVEKVEPRAEDFWDRVGRIQHHGREGFETNK